MNIIILNKKIKLNCLKNINKLFQIIIINKTIFKQILGTTFKFKTIYCFNYKLSKFKN